MLSVLFAGLTASAQNWTLLKSVDYSKDQYTGDSVLQEATLSVEDGALTIVNAAATTNNWDLQYPIIDGLNLVGGEPYKVVITLEGGSGASMSTWLGDYSANSPIYGTSIPATKGQVTLDYTAKADNEAGWLQMQTGSFVGTIKVYSVEVYYIPAVAGEAKFFVPTAVTGVARMAGEDTAHNAYETINVFSPAGAAQDWDTQFFIAWNEALSSGNNVRVKFDYMSDIKASMDTQSHAAPGEYKHWAAIGSLDATSEWKTYNGTFSVANEANGMKSIAFNLSKDRANDVNFYFKNLFLMVEKKLNAETLGETAMMSIEGAQQAFTALNKATLMNEEYADYVEVIEEMTPVLNAIAQNLQEKQTWLFESYEAGTLMNDGQEIFDSLSDIYTSMSQFYTSFLDAIAEAAPEDPAVEPAFIGVDDEEVALNSHVEASVATAQAMVVNFVGMPNLLGASYAINDMTMYTDSLGTVWNVDESKDLAVGEMSVNGRGYVQFEEALKFYTGSKYQLKITTYTAAEAADSTVAANPIETVYTYVFNGAYEEEIETAIEPAFTLGEELVALNSHSEVSVDKADGLTVHFDNMPNVMGISYAINAMKEVSDSLSTFWVVDESYDIAVGETTVNGKAFVEFEDVLTFVQGQKYQLKITVYGMPDAEELGTYTYTFNGAAAEEMEVETALMNGEEAVTLSTHSNVSVETANAIRVNVMNRPDAIGAVYAINEMKMGEDEEGTFWTVGAEVAVGEMMFNGIGFNEFEAPINFEQGKKYQVTVTIFGGDPTKDPEEIATEVYEFNGAYAPAEPETLEGDFMVMNVATGMFLNGANSWGTKASVTKHGQFFTIAMLENGKYTLDSHISNGGDNHFLGTNGFVDSPAAELEIVEVVDGVYAIKSDSLYLATNTANTEANFDATEANELAQWKLVTKGDIFAAAEVASADAPADMTALIGDANFGRNNQYFDMWQGDKPGKGGDNANMNAEKWGGNSQEFDSYQILEGLPNGLYTLKAQGFYRFNNTTDNTNDHATDSAAVINSYVYANEIMEPLKSIADEEAVTTYGKMPFSQAEASEAFGKGLYQNELTFTVTDGVLQLGVKKIAHPGCDWTVWDNFELYYLGSGVEEDLPIDNVALINGEEIISLNTHSEVSVEKMTAIKANFGVDVKSATYAITPLLPSISEDAMTWTPGVPTVGEFSINTVGYAEQAYTFEQGYKYQITISATLSDSTVVEQFYTINGAFVKEEPADQKITVIYLAQGPVLDIIFEDQKDVAPTWNVDVLLDGEKINVELGQDWNVVYGYPGKALAPGEHTLVFPVGSLIFDSQNENTVEYTVTFTVEGANPEVADCDLTREMFHEWDSYEANANIVGDGGCDYVMGVSTGMPYGNGSVIGAQYADLSAWSTLALTVTEGAPRLLFNRQDMGGSSSDFLEINNPDSPYVSEVKDGVWYINLAKIVEEKGYAHLNVIKGANWANVTITEAKLYAEPTTGINAIQTASRNGKFMENGKLVIVKNGVRYNAAGARVIK